MKLTKKQQELKTLLDKKNLTLKQAASVLKISPKATYKLYRRLKENQAFTLSPIKSEMGGVGSPHTLPPIFAVRLHNIQFHIEPSFLMERYFIRRMKSESFKFEGHTLVLGKKHLELYVNQDFLAENADMCQGDMWRWLWPYLERVEALLGVVIVKDKSANVKLVRSHYAEVGNELAQDITARKEKFKLVGADNKPWLEVDCSKGVPELETIHPALSKEDMNKIKPFFDDLRTLEAPVLLSSVMGVIREQAATNLETAKGLQGVVIALRALLPASPGVPVETGGYQVKPDYIG